MEVPQLSEDTPVLRFVGKEGASGPLRVLVTVCTHGDEVAGLLAANELIREGFFGHATGGSAIAASEQSCGVRGMGAAEHRGEAHTSGVTISYNGDGDGDGASKKVPVDGASSSGLGSSFSALGDNPHVGSVTLVLANPGAYARGKRFVDVNLNRIVCGDCPRLAPTNSIEPSGYEYTLVPGLQEHIAASDVYLDIHSTSAASPPFAITVDNDVSHAMAFSMPVHYILQGLLQSLDGTTMHYATRCLDSTGYPRIALTVECGQHRDPVSVSVAKEAIQALVKYAGRESSLLAPQPHQHVLHCDTAQPLREGFNYAGHPPHAFERVEYNQLIARDDFGKL